MSGIKNGRTEKGKDHLYATTGFGSPSGKPAARPNKAKKSSIDLDNPDDVERLLKAIATGEALTDPAPEAARPQHYQPVFKHPLPVSDHSAPHEANLRRVQCCALAKQAAAAVTLGDAWALEEVFMRGAPISQPDAGGYTPLHAAAQANNFECVITLLRMGSDVNARTLSGTTPLFLAAAADARDCYQVILEAGGVMEVRNADERPPMELLEMSPRKPAKNLQSADLLAYVDSKAGVVGRYTTF